MDIKLQKKKYNNLKKLTKVDENNNAIDGQEELYVRIEEVADNLLNTDATPLSDEIFNQINWKDEEALIIKQATVLPDPIANLTQIVALENGQIWCVPGSNYAAFKLGAEDIEKYLKKNFQSYEALTILGSNTKIGALPTDFTTTGNSNASTYLDIKDGNIAFKIDGTQKHVLNSEKVSFNHNNGEICISDSEIALKHHNDKTTIGLQNGSFYIKGNCTQISEDLSLDKLNFFTGLSNAVYGNNTMYLEFFPNYVRFKTSDEKELFVVKNDGTVVANGSIVINSGTIDTYTKNYLDNNFGSYFNTYLNGCFESKFFECYENVTSSRITLFEGASLELTYNLIDSSNLYQINFSDKEDGYIMTIYFNGTNIESLGQIYKSQTNAYYLIKQNYASDEDEDDGITIIKYSSSGTLVGNVYIRGLYKF